jgi:hypothetical protein
VSATSTRSAARGGRPSDRLDHSPSATLEDHARGNYWADRLHNPEHRIDKIGVLVRTVAGHHD